MNLGAADSISSVHDTSFVSDALKADRFKAQLEAHPANTPAKQEQPAPKKEEKADAGGDWMTRGLGALQAVGGVLEVVGGVAGGIITSETGVGAVVGGAVALHGIDDIQAGLRTAFSGQSTETFTQAATTDAAKALGASPGVAMGIGLGVDILAGGVTGGGSKAAIKGAGLIDDAAKLANKADDAAKLAGKADDAAKAGAKGDDAARLGGEGAKFGLATSTDYKATFFDAHPELEGSVVVHHAVEQQVLTRYPGLVSDSQMHSVENLRGIPKELNSDLHLSQIRREWNQFYRQNPNPTQQDLLDKATQIDAKFGAQFKPPVR
jgi:hypothetical protein